LGLVFVDEIEVEARAFSSVKASSRHINEIEPRSKNGIIWRLVTNNRTSQMATTVAYLKLASKFPFGVFNWTFTSHCEGGSGQNNQSLIELTRVRFHNSLTNFHFSIVIEFFLNK
jgi:hypothetical protein